MADIRVKDLTEASVPGADYYLLTDSATDGVKKVKTTNVIAKADIGLGNVDNTSDATKDAAATALTNKISINKVAITTPATGATLAIADGATLTAPATASVSGTNTGDQTITLTGDVTGSGTGSFAATIGANAVTNAKLATAADGTIKSNISGASAAPSDNTITAVLDKLFGTVQGNIIYRDATAWAALAPSTSGYFLKTQGAGANPAWASVPGGGDLLSTNNLSDVANAGASMRNLGGLDVSTVVAITTTTTLTSSAFGKLHLISGASNYTVTLPTPVGNTGSIIAFQVDTPTNASKLYTLSTPSGVIGRQGASFIVWASESVVIRSDGTNWTVIDGRPVPFVGTLLRTTDQAGIVSGGTVVLFTSAASDPSGLNLCFDSTNSRFVPPRFSYWDFDGGLYITQSGSPTFIQAEVNDLGASAALGARVNATGPLTAGTTFCSGHLYNSIATAVSMKAFANGTSPTVAGATVAARFSYRETPIW